MVAETFLKPFGERLSEDSIANLISYYLLGISQLKKVCLRYADMRANFNKVTYDEWNKNDNSEVWLFSSGVTPYKDYDDTTNIPIPIERPEINVVSNNAVTSLDLPIWFTPLNPIKWIVLLSQDPMPRSKWYNDCRDAVCSSPFGLHTRTWRERGNGGGRIWGLVKNLTQNNIGVYLTDIRKFYFRTSDEKRKYIAPSNEIIEIYRSLLLEELEIIKPNIIVTLGNQSASALSDLINLKITPKILNLPHFSGQAQGAIKEFFNIPKDEKSTIEKQVLSYTTFIINNL